MVKAIQLAIPASLPRRTASSLMLKQTSLPAASCTSLFTTSTMNNVTSDFPSYTHQGFRQASPFDSNNQGDSTLHGQTGEPGSADPASELGTTGRPRMLTKGCKRSVDAAFGSLPPQGSASKRSRTGGDKLTRAGEENVAVLSAPVSNPIASMQIKYRPPKVSAAVSRAYAGVLSMPDLLENALSPDDVIAAWSTCEFLGLPLRPGIGFANFIEGLKILVMHAGLRRPSLPDWSGDRIFNVGISRIAAACTKLCEPGQAAAERAEMRLQMKTALFAEGTPHDFIRLATALWKSTKKERRADPTLTHSYGSLKELGIFNELKAINRATVIGSQLSSHERLDAMRRAALAAVRTVGPEAAGMTAITSTTAITHPVQPASGIPLMSYPALEQAMLATSWPLYQMASVSVPSALEACPARAWTSQALLGLETPPY